MSMEIVKLISMILIGVSFIFPVTAVSYFVYYRLKDLKELKKEREKRKE
jgi:hypothetical protein